MGFFVTATAQTWLPRLNKYRTPDTLRSLFEVLLTAMPFLGLWALMWFLSTLSIWLAVIVMVPTAMFMVRLFMIQHDCGHGALFKSRRANDWTGRIIGIFTLTPYDFWRQSHAMHHASSGNLDRRGIGDIDTLTVGEYTARSRWGRIKYRLYRNPLVMFGIGPLYLFVFQNRLPLGAMRDGAMPWASTQLTNLGIAVLYAPLVYLLGWQNFLLMHAPVVMAGAAIGVWLFYVQHQFEETSWEPNATWTHANAALHGSSFYDLPRPLMWLTGYIGIHHLHHLSSRIPFYNLPKVVKDFPELKGIGRLTLWQSLACVRLTLWDEHKKRLVSFRQARLAR